MNMVLTQQVPYKFAWNHFCVQVVLESGVYCRFRCSVSIPLIAVLFKSCLHTLLLTLDNELSWHFTLCTPLSMAGTYHGDSDLQLAARLQKHKPLPSASRYGDPARKHMSTQTIYCTEILPV